MGEILNVENLKVYFYDKRPLLSTKPPTATRAVDGVSFSMQEGETLGLVGESGCGKSTRGRAILGMYPPTEGRIVFMGKDLSGMTAVEKRLNTRQIQMIFQDPFSSLNPKKTIRQILSEPFVVHGLFSSAEREQRVMELLDMVELDRAFLKRYPHEFSGGQRQRIGIARALALNPRFLVCDEAISALDVSIQAQIIGLLENLREKMGLSYLFIAHNLAVVRHISDRVAVMYLGKLMEHADKKEPYDHPAHPYTEALISAVTIPDPEQERKRKAIMLKGDPPTPRNPPSGCRFCTRCKYAKEICFAQEPQLRDLGGGHLAACHFPLK